VERERSQLDGGFLSQIPQILSKSMGEHVSGADLDYEMHLEGESTAMLSVGWQCQWSFGGETTETHLVSRDL
jgi:hypothetical protein